MITKSRPDTSDFVDRLRKRAEIRRQIPTRKSVQEGKTDRTADLLDDAANVRIPYYGDRVLRVFALLSTAVLVPVLAPLAFLATATAAGGSGTYSASRSRLQPKYSHRAFRLSVVVLNGRGPAIRESVVR